MARIRGIGTPWGGDGFSRMHESPIEPESELGRLIVGDDPEEREEVFRLMLELRRHPFGTPLALDLDRLAMFFGVELKPQMYQHALREADRRLERDIKHRLEEQAEILAGKQPTRHRQHNPLVYYMLQGGLVKIGTSRSLTGRLETFRPERLLAVEPGDTSVERQRHDEFAEWRSHGEWFLPSSALDAHIERCRAEHSELMEPWVNWSPGMGHAPRRGQATTHDRP